MIPLIGYTNALSFRPGATVEMKVSSTVNQSYRAELVRIISDDPKIRNDRVWSSNQCLLSLRVSIRPNRK